jgi:hypothetical protein
MPTPQKMVEMTVIPEEMVLEVVVAAAAEVGVGMATEAAEAGMAEAGLTLVPVALGEDEVRGKRTLGRAHLEETAGRHRATMTVMRSRTALLVGQLELEEVPVHPPEPGVVHEAPAHQNPLLPPLHHPAIPHRRHLPKLRITVSCLVILSSLSISLFILSFASLLLNTSAPMCKCGAQTVERSVVKDGPNK